MKQRKKNRLSEFDYSLPGYYYLTICTKEKFHYFGSIKDDKMKINKIGTIAEKFWNRMPEHFTCIELDEYIIMPNHIHGIVIINDAGNTYMHSLHGDRTKMTLSKCVQQFKASVTRYVNSNYMLNNFGWQKSFYERIIRNEKELFYIRRYIRQNPLIWNIEKQNIDNLELCSECIYAFTTWCK